MKKSTVLEIFNSLDDDLEIQEFIAELLLVDQIEKAIDEADNEKVVSYETIKQRFYKRN